MVILGIAKLKCMNYIWRTFGVRNKLNMLLDGGSEVYLAGVQSNFFTAWGVLARNAPATIVIRRSAPGWLGP
jgi:hypothetical protein